jgi:hypothetical protein
MKYALLIYYSTTGVSDRPAAELTQAWVDYTRATRESGVFVGAEQLTATDTATSVRIRAGDRLLTDGPFMETKEHLLGFFLIDIPDLDTALDWAERMPNKAHGTTEIRAVESGRPWQAGLAILEPVLAAGTLVGYAPLQAAHADLLERLGSGEAATAWERAAQAAGNTALQPELHLQGSEGRRGGNEGRSA